MSRFKVSVIVLSYNTKEILQQCLSALFDSNDIKNYQVIVVDNGSSDGSVETIRNFQTPCLAGRQANPKFQTNSNPPAGGPKIKLIENKKNLGFARGNNAARKIAKGKYVLFLNSDVILEKDTILKTLDYLEKHPRVSGITCRLELPNHRLDKDTRRSFPTPWVALSHFSRLDKLFPKSKLFARYWYSYIPENKIHKIEVAQGAYFLIRKDVLDQVGWFDQDYFLDGEDIDLCWKIKEAGWPIIYYPKAKAIHLKGASKGKSQKNRVHLEERKKFILAGVESMEIFYRKRLKDRYPSWLTGLIITGIKILGGIRILKLKRGLAN